jgi:8-hydroxy-5-deazaflavin:NADPH oxidoreductase
MSIERIAIVGGTGEQGRGLARRFGMAGLTVVIGSRDGQRAAESALSLNLPTVTGASNVDAINDVDAVIIAVPWAGHADTIKELAPLLARKIVIDCVNPLGFDGQGAFGLDVPEGSACQQAQALLPEAIVVGAFHHISAVLLLDENVEKIDGDVLVLGDDREATDAVQELVTKIPTLRGVYGGRLRNAGQVESFTANLISINRRYKAHAGLSITDI